MNQNIKKNKTILVIEDDAALLEVIKTKLELSFFTVVVSTSVARAFSTEFSQILSKNQALTKNDIEAELAYLETLENVDAIWLDHNLIGREDGIDFVVKFKANGGRWSSLPILVVSNSADTELIKTYTELGVTKYYLKAEHKLADIIDDLKVVLSV